MKIGLLLGSFLLMLLFTPPSAQAQWCHDQDRTYWCGDPNACEGVCSESYATCDTACTDWGGNWTTCGGGGTDYDGDGVANSSDNCLCNANSNQADCDTDGIGDVCDPRSEKWVFVEDLGYCDWDGDQHFGYTQIERYSAIRYQDVCSGSYCSDKTKIDEASCVPNTGSMDCCQLRYEDSLCDTDNQCGTPDCPF